MRNSTLEKMKMLRLYGMLKTYNILLEKQNFEEMSIDDALAGMIDAEWDERYNRKLCRLLKQAKLRYQATVEYLDFRKERNLSKDLILRLSLCNWIKESKNILITGKTGSGKSYLACALGHQACINEYKVRYLNCLKFCNELKFAKAEGTYEKKINQLKKVNLIIIDDFGLQVLDTQSRLSLLEILEDRYENSSTIISSQIQPDKWYEIIGDPTIADAICDRIIHRSYKINLKGKKSMREKTVHKLKNNSGNKLPSVVS
jgi:DNA replication protein DnaC